MSKKRLGLHIYLNSDALELLNKANAHLGTDIVLAKLAKDAINARLTEILNTPPQEKPPRNSACLEAARGWIEQRPNCLFICDQMADALGKNARTIYRYIRVLRSCGMRIDGNVGVGYIFRPVVKK